MSSPEHTGGETPKANADKGTEMNKIIARIALPIASAGILSAGALGLAGIASAQTTTTQTGSHTSIVTTPDTYAKPAPSAMPGWRFHHGHGHAYLGQAHN
jgi:hypothetical protein